MGAGLPLVSHKMPKGKGSIIQWACPFKISKIIKYTVYESINP